MNQNSKGEVLTILTFATLAIIGISTLVSSVFLNKNKQTTKTQAEDYRCPGGGCGYCTKNNFWDQGCFYEKQGTLVQPTGDTMCRCSDVDSCVIYNGHSYVLTGNSTGVWCGNDCRIHPGSDESEKYCSTPASPLATPIPPTKPLVLTATQVPTPRCISIQCDNNGKFYSYFDKSKGGTEEYMEGYGCDSSKDEKILNLITYCSSPSPTPSPASSPTPVCHSSSCNGVDYFYYEGGDKFEGINCTGNKIINLNNFCLPPIQPPATITTSVPEHRCRSIKCGGNGEWFSYFADNKYKYMIGFGCTSNIYILNLNVYCTSSAVLPPATTSAPIPATPVSPPVSPIQTLDDQNGGIAAPVG
ncbi:MAG: hypothetical protein Q7R95_00730, partial [bacterium]|nr:hypothetical protein [bacterium]